MGLLRNIFGRRETVEERVEAIAQKYAAKQAEQFARRYLALKARYDAASTSLEALKNWSNVDGLAATAAASPPVRALLRNRGRHETLNNPYLDGIVQTHASDIIGRGPRLGVRTGVAAIDSLIEREFRSWMKAARLGKRLRLAVQTLDSQGEVFFVLFRNPKLNHPIKLDFKPYEGDQCASSDLSLPGADPADGIEYDSWGNPAYYNFLRQHPGDTTWAAMGPRIADRVPADRVIHLFIERRPGQLRGIPRISSSLTLFPERRSFRHSVLTAARIASQMGAAYLEAQFDAKEDDDDQDDITAGSQIELDVGMVTALPTGYKLGQMKAEQPSTTYSEFDDRLISESARPLNMPSNVARCDSSSYNYASGRLDHQTYDRSNEIDEGDLEDDVCDRFLDAWLQAAMDLPGYLPWRTAAVTRGGLPHSWLWRKRPHVDPSKEANAQETRLESTTSTVAREIAGDAVDIEEHLDELGREVALYRERGLVHPADRNKAAASSATDEDETEQDFQERIDEAVEDNASMGGKPGRNGHGHNRLTEIGR